MTLETKTVRMEIKELGEDGTFVGLAAVYNNRDLGGDVILPGAFTKTIADNGGKFPLLYGHELNVGISEVEDTASGLLAKGRLNLGKQAARDVHSDMKFYHDNGLAFGMSIGYLTLPSRTEVKDGTRYLREVKLFENTLTEFPMNEKARVQMVKSLKPSEKDFSEELDGIETRSRGYMMLRALDDALYQCQWMDGDATAKSAEVEKCIDQFKAEYTAWFPRLMAMREKDMPGIERKEGRKLSAATRDALMAAMADHQAAMDRMKALLDEEPESKQVPPLAGAAPATSEPAFDHSRATALKTLLKGNN